MITYTKDRELGVLSKSGDYSTEVNILSWNGGKPKIDIRKWCAKENGPQPLKGISLTNEEARELVHILSAAL